MQQQLQLPRQQKQKMKLEHNIVFIKMKSICTYPWYYSFQPLIQAIRYINIKTMFLSHIYLKQKESILIRNAKIPQEYFSRYHT